MQERTWRVGLALMLTLCFAVELAAHGGGYTAAAPGPARSGGAGTGGLGMAPPSQSTVATAAGDLFDSWEFWWQVNRDRFLDLKGRQLTASIRTGGPSFPTGRGRSYTPSSAKERLRREVQRDVVPAMLAMLEGDQDSDVLAAVIIAAARSVEGDARSEVLRRAVALLAHSHPDVQTSAAISMGVLGERRATRVLVELLSDSSLGRVLVGGQQPTERVRAFAALALGMLARPQGLEALMAVLCDAPDSERELKWGAITALGMLPSDHPNAPAVCELLLEQVGTSSVDPMLRGAAVLSLGRLGRLEALPVLVKLVRAHNSSDHERRSAVIAVGLLASMKHSAALSALHRCLDNESDRPSRHFALIALGEIGARDRWPEQHAEEHERILKRLSRGLGSNGRRQSQQSWAALGAAIYGRSQLASRALLAEAIREELEDIKDPSVRSAFVLASALLGDGDASVELAALWHETRDDGLRGYVALALGMLDDSVLVEEFRALLIDPSTSAVLRRRVATALGLLRDRVSTELLIESLGNAEQLDLRAATTRGLALLGESRSLGALLQLVESGSSAGEVRAFAGVALGLLGERSELPWNEPIRAHCNYLLGFHTLNEVLGLF
ncbi:MAG: hypothetical protein DHS20C15_30410 [Planctomycetota bacterium]|nr:MAG: hypothetical protein DHS20C15_30410 [Planctomycetota bacterium]